MSQERPLPQRFGRYELLLRIGSGGMASVYLARARGPAGFQRDVAIKLTHPHLADEADFVESLLQEARIAARIRHAHVVPVLDVGVEGTEAYLVMDYVEGEVLSALARAERSRSSRMPLPIALRILSDALAGLHAAHELRDDGGALLGIVHRDVSPQNVIVGLDGLARLTDFGVARVASMASATKTGLLKGKLGYASPEQVRSPRDIDRRTDVWAAGVVAWELVTGQLLRPKDDEAATLLRIVSEEPPRARSVRADVPEAIDDAIASALRMDRGDRLPTAEELRRRLLEAAASCARVADPAEVAEYVERMAGEKLRDRRRSVELALEAQSQPQATGTTSARTRWVMPAAVVAAVGVVVAFVGASASSKGRAASADAVPPPTAATLVETAAPSAPPPPPPSAIPATPSSAPAASAARRTSTPTPPRRNAAPAPAPTPRASQSPARPALPADPLDDAR